jgi:hypothetical protein
MIGDDRDHTNGIGAADDGRDRSTDDERDRPTASIGRRRLLQGGAAALAVGLGGCVSTEPRVETSGVDGSEVFDSVSVAESVVGKRAILSISLTEAATTDLGVRRVNSVTQSGSNYQVREVESGETSLKLYVPTRQRTTITATNYSGETIATIEVQVTGDRVF